MRPGSPAEIAGPRGDAVAVEFFKRGALRTAVCRNNCVGCSQQNSTMPSVSSARNSSMSFRACGPRKLMKVLSVTVLFSAWVRRLSTCNNAAQPHRILLILQSARLLANHTSIYLAYSYLDNPLVYA